jgi:hypothetical protein
MTGPTVPEEFLKAENAGLRLLLEQAGIDARALLAQAGIDAAQRETADRLQKIILEELHHRIKNTLATVSAIASQSLHRAWPAGDREPAPGTGARPRSAAAGAMVERQPCAHRPGLDRAF